MATPFTFTLDSFQITDTRSLHKDTDYVSFTLVVNPQGGKGKPQTLKKSMGDLNNGTFPVNLSFPNVTVNPTEPGLLAPPSFKTGANQYVVAQHSDGSYVLPVGAISGVTSSPATPGETIVIYGVGFGSVTPNIPAGEIATVTNKLTASLQILFDKTPATLPYFGLAPNFVGLYQFNVTVPAVGDNDLVPFTFNLGGVAGTQTLFTTVHQ